jgi:hypothetical protein
MNSTLKTRNLNVENAPAFGGHMQRFMRIVLACSLLSALTACPPRVPTLEGSLKYDGPSKPSVVITQDDDLSDAIGEELSNRGFPVIGQRRVSAVLREKSMQLSGMKSMDEEKLLEAGKFLHADVLLLVEARKSPDETIDEAIITLVGVRSETAIGSFHYQNGRVKENPDGSAKRIAQAISSSVR